MAKYEMTVVLPEKTTAAKKKKAEEMLGKIFKLNKGKIAEKKDWGEIELAYPIKKSKSGTFLHYVLELDKETIAKIDEKLRLEESIIRYLIVRVD